MSHSPAWQAARDARRERRAQDPAVQDRRRQHQAREARGNAERWVKADALGSLTEDGAA